MASRKKKTETDETPNEEMTSASRPATEEELAMLDGPKLSAEDVKAADEVTVTPIPPETKPKGQGKVARGPRIGRRGLVTGEVPLRTFVRAHSEKDDQLVGFATWCGKNGHTKYTMKRWRELLKEFQTRPVAQG